VHPLPLLSAGFHPSFFGNKKQVRSKLLSFLEKSETYNVPALVSRLQGTSLHSELVLVYAKVLKPQASAEKSSSLLT